MHRNSSSTSKEGLSWQKTEPKRKPKERKQPEAGIKQLPVCLQRPTLCTKPLLQS